MHRHRYYEFALITKGACIHEYRGVKVSLVPGDIFFIEPGERHGYEVSSGFELINCQFYPELLSQECKQALCRARTSMNDFCRESGLGVHWNELIHDMFKEESDFRSDCILHQEKLNRQGIIHLSIDERREIEYWLEKMAEEQEMVLDGMEFVKSACLQMILMFFQRLYNKKKKNSSAIKEEKREAIYDAIAYIEQHLEEKLDIDALAARVYWSRQYFRTVFKEVTGLTPVEYINRIRIIKALEYLERNKCSVSEAAASVGIYDANYFTRLFKKKLGYSPRYFKSIM